MREARKEQQVEKKRVLKAIKMREKYKPESGSRIVVQSIFRSSQVVDGSHEDNGDCTLSYSKRA